MRSPVPRVLSSVLQDLRAQRLRTAVNILALFVGVLAVAVVAVAGTIAQGVFVAHAEQEVAREVTYQVSLTANGAATDIPGFWHRIQRRTAGQPVGTVLLEQTSIRRADDTSPTPTQIDCWLYLGDYSSVRRLPLLKGQWPNPKHDYPPQIVANQSATRTLPKGPFAIASNAPKPAVTVRVAAVIADAQDNPTIYLPWKTAATFLPATTDQGQLELLVTSADTDPDKARQLAALAAAQTGLTVTSVDRIDTVGSIQGELHALQLVFGLCALIALFVAALGIINLGLATVSQRSRELSIRRAVGATRRNLVTLVVGGALAHALVAAALAIGCVAAGMYLVLPRFVPPSSAVTLPNLPWATVAYALIAACGTALIGAALPAARAASVDIAAVLRD